MFKSKVTAFLLVLLPALIFSSPTLSKSPIAGVEYHLAFSINPAHNSGYINFAIIGVSNGRIVYNKFNIFIVDRLSEDSCKHPGGPRLGGNANP